MEAWSQSHFLQALGWATLNSFWQMALLWCLFLGASFILKLSAARKYQLAVAALLSGLGWFAFTFITYYQNASTTYAFFETTISHSNSFLHIFLFSASLTYLILLFFPAVRLYKNWQAVQCIRNEKGEKAHIQHRLFVKRISAELRIKKRVLLFVSNLVSSPLTIGYLKPIILLPVAALNQLTTAQVEAILLHELSHIRRYDYLINLIVSFIHTLLYFNPFVKAFVDVVEAERENCCDELVLQFGYDKVSYASALLQLEKNAAKHQVLTLAASGKQNLLTRIEKIVGMEKKKTFRLIQIVPLFAAAVCVLLFNSVLIIRDSKSGATISYTNDTVLLPWQLNTQKKAKLLPSTNNESIHQANNSTASSDKITIDILNAPVDDQQSIRNQIASKVETIMPVNFDDIDGRLTKEEKANVAAAMQTTKRVVSELKWKDIEAAMAEVLTEKEKALAKKEYLREVDNVNWIAIEQNIKANYDALNWQQINESIDKAMVQVKLDSVQHLYSVALTELTKAEKDLKNQKKLTLSPLPDCSVEEITMAKQTLRKNLDSLKSVARPKKIVRL